MILKILLGDDFSRYVLGAGFHELVAKHRGFIADDLWVMYTLTLNELKIASMFGRTNPRMVYEASKNVAEINSVFNDFQRLYRECSSTLSSNPCSLEDYMRRLNEVVDKLAQTVLSAFSRIGRSLRLLESNDVTMAYVFTSDTSPLLL
ncbi:MAG: hypothetical protein QW196_06040 [Sulfolobales archaeon]